MSLKSKAISVGQKAGQQVPPYVALSLFCLAEEPKANNKMAAGKRKLVQVQVKVLCRSNMIHSTNFKMLILGTAIPKFNISFLPPSVILFILPLHFI